jgi:hypothetical protein
MHRVVRPYDAKLPLERASVDARQRALHCFHDGCALFAVDPGNSIVEAQVRGHAEYITASFVQEHLASFESVVPGSELRRSQSQLALFGCPSQIPFGAGG